MKDYGLNFDSFIFTYKEYDDINNSAFKWHIHPFYELLYIVDGKINYIVENKQYLLGKGDLLFIPSACYHTVHSIIEAPYKRFCVDFLDNFIDKKIIDEIFSNYEYIKLAENPTIENIMHLLMEITNSISKEKQLFLCKNMMESLLIYISSMTRNEKPHNTQIISKNCQDIIDFINVNLTQITSLEQIASHFFFSKTYLNHLFKKEMNIGVMTFVRNKKILLAQKLLKEGRKPNDIFYECGFSNYVSFYRAYCKYCGVSPSESYVKTPKQP